jgi:hypothetical protein
MLLHRNMPAGPEPFLKAIAPYRAELVVGVEWTLHLVWAGRPLCARRNSCCSRPRP